MDIPRKEHPKPQFEARRGRISTGPGILKSTTAAAARPGACRKRRRNFREDHRAVLPAEQALRRGAQGFSVRRVWYRRAFTLTQREAESRTVLHVGAADYCATLYINGQMAGEHKGGYVSFSFDISRFVHAGEKTSLPYTSRTTSATGSSPRGKQSELFRSHDCDYTRTTGIWQTVWLEFTPRAAYIESAKYFPDVFSHSLTIQAKLKGCGVLRATASYEGRVVGTAEAISRGGIATLTVDLAETHLWEVGCGRLYDLELRYGDDSVRSYFGLRSIRLDGMKFRINEKSVYQRLVLDQGFYPDGIYTAPTDADLERDIDLSLAMGFNGARLHQKIFEERFLYYCDKKGYIVWGRIPRLGARPLLCRLHLACSLNGSRSWSGFQPPRHHRLVPAQRDLGSERQKAVRRGDTPDLPRHQGGRPHPPLIDTSGNFHVETDIFDVHDYEQDPAVFKANYDRLMTEHVLHDRFDKIQHYAGEPTFVSEYGGIGWSEDKNSWGYGTNPKNAGGVY